jgi:hypothetical protein
MPQSSKNTINRTLELTPNLTPPHKLTSITLRPEVERKISRITLRKRLRERNLQTHSAVWSRDLRGRREQEQEKKNCTRSSSSPLRNMQRL